MKRNLLAIVATLVAALVFWAVLEPSQVFAHWGQEPARIQGRTRPDTPPDGPRGRAAITFAGGEMLRLAPAPAEASGTPMYTATFELKNVGEGPLEVYRVGIEQ